MSQILLLGTVHRDPAGKSRLLKALSEIRPRAISLEVSPASINIRRYRSRRWIALFRERLSVLSNQTGKSVGQLMAGAALRGVFEYLRLPYEYRAAMQHAKENSCPLFLLDDSDLASSFLKRVEKEILTLKNMSLLEEAGRDFRLDDEVTAEYRKARTGVFNSNHKVSHKVNNHESWAEREAQLSQKLRLLHQGLVRRADTELTGQQLIQGLIVSPDAVGYVPEHVDFRPEPVHVYIGGWEHLIEDEKGETFYSRLKDLNPDRLLCHTPDSHLHGLF